MMGARFGLAMASLVGAACLGACGEFSEYESIGTASWSATRGRAASEPDVDYGWSRAIDSKTLERKAGEASSAVAGHSLEEIVTSKSIRVREDDKSCVTCHSWAAWSDRESFCARVDDFVAMPTAKGNASDPASAKPANLKKLLLDWKKAGCPE